MTDKLPLDAKVALIRKMADDLEFYKETGSSKCPSEQHYKIVSRDEDISVEQKARFSALKKFNEGMKKVAFDTRRINQETDRIPRRNLQNWHRAEPFVDDETKGKIEIFSKLFNVVTKLKEELDNQPEWFDSYTRVLYTNLDRMEMKREGDRNVEVYKPHIAYLEQLVYNRYRMTLDDVKEASEGDLRRVLLSKDEDLKDKREFLRSTGGRNLEKKTGELSTDEKILALLEASLNKKDSHPKDALGELFGGSSLRRAGEKSVERTITITIRDNVVE